MSEGTQRVCAPNLGTGRAHCGRKTKNTDEWEHVTCADCQAARRADEVKR